MISIPHHTIDEHQSCLVHHSSRNKIKTKRQLRDVSIDTYHLPRALVRLALRVAQDQWHVHPGPAAECRVEGLLDCVAIHDYEPIVVLSALALLKDRKIEWLKVMH